MIVTFITFFVVLSLLVFVHEFGHFIVAKKLGIRVEEFGFGLPPRVWGVKRGETIYSINALPIGGFVRLSGEDEAENSGKLSESERKRHFWARSKKERAAVLLAGVTMNFLLATAIISYIFTQGVYVPSDHVTITGVVADSPGAAAGIHAEDIVVSMGGKDIKTSEELITTTNEFAGTETTMVVLRDGTPVTLTVTPRKDPPENQGPMGITITNLEEKRYAWYQAPFYGMIEAIKLSYIMVTTLLMLIYRLVTFQKVAVDVGGPVAIYQATGQAVKSGVNSVLQLAGLLSLNLAIINVLPIPALDGGRLLFVVLEKFIGRKVKPRAEQVAHQIGFAFLIGLIVLVTVNDILRIIRG